MRSQTGVWERDKFMPNDIVIGLLINKVEFNQNIHA